jgi:hypothetical protein
MRSIDEPSYFVGDIGNQSTDNAQFSEASWEVDAD